MTFRHPLRNEWDRVQADIAAAADKPGAEGAIARAMLDLVPPLLAVIERERDRATPADARLSAFVAIAGLVVENAVETAYAQPWERRAALHQVLARIEQAAAANLMKKPGRSEGGIMLPGAP